MIGVVEAFTKLADTVIARLHGTPTPQDNDVFIMALDAVAKMRTESAEMAKTFGSGHDRLAKGDTAMNSLAADLAKAAAGWEALHERLLKVAAEPVIPPGQPWVGVPLHLIGRAITRDTVTWGNA